MDNLLEKISADLKSAMRDKAELMVSVLRMLIAAIRNREIAQRDGDKVVLSDAEIQAVIKSEIKKRKDSIITYEQGGREDLALQEKKEIEILQSYLPEQVSSTDLEKIIADVIATSETKDFGRIMGEAMKQVKGQADGNQVGEMVKRLLAQ